MPLARAFFERFDNVNLRRLAQKGGVDEFFGMLTRVEFLHDQHIIAVPFYRKQELAFPAMRPLVLGCLVEDWLPFRVLIY